MQLTQLLFLVRARARKRERERSESFILPRRVWEISPITRFNSRERSSYSRLSTIRCVAFVLTGLKKEGGKKETLFTDARLIECLSRGRKKTTRMWVLPDILSDGVGVFTYRAYTRAYTYVASQIRRRRRRLSARPSEGLAERLGERECIALRVHWLKPRAQGRHFWAVRDIT